MTRFALLLSTVLLAAAGPAEHPPLVPAHDALVAYHLAPATGEAIDLRVAYLAGAREVRFNLPDMSYVLVTPAKRAVTMVVPLENTRTPLPWEAGPQSLFLLDEHARYTRKGDTTVAGVKCTQWEAVLEQDHRTVCVSADGLLLRSQSSDPQGRRNLIEATIVRVEAVPEALFTVPNDYETVTPDASPPK